MTNTKQQRKVQRYSRTAKDLTKVSPQGILTVVNSVMLLVILGISFFSLFALFKLYRKAPPTIVLDSFGHVERGYYAPSDYRSPESMQLLVGNVMKMMLVWNNEIPNPENPESVIEDPGMPVKSNLSKRSRTSALPTMAVLGSSAFSPEIQLGVLEAVRELIPGGALRVLQGEITSSLKIQKITTPTPVEEGAAEHYLDLYSTMVIQDSTSGEIRRQIYNKRFYLRPVPLVNHPVPQAASLLEKTTERIRNGLEIYQVESIPEEVN